MSYRVVSLAALLASTAASAQDVVTYEVMDFTEAPVFIANVAGSPNGLPPVDLRFEELLRPHLAKRDARLLAEELQLLPEQRLLLEVLLKDYEEEFAAASQALRDARATLEPPPTQQYAQRLQNLDLPFANVIEFSGDGEGGWFAPTIMVDDAGDGAHGWTAAAVRDTAEPVAISITIAATDDATDLEGIEFEVITEQIHELESVIQDRLELRLADLTDALEEAEEEKEYTPSELRTLALEFRAAKEELYQRFFRDLETVLIDRQLGLLDGTKRAQRKSAALPTGMYGGESTDMARLLGEADPSFEDEALETAMLDEHELELDTALLRREQLLIDAEIESIDLIENTDLEPRLRVADMRSTARVGVRDANHGFLDAVTSLIPENQAETLQDRAFRAGFPDIYSRSRAERLLEKALELETLDEDRRVSIESMLDDYRTRRERIAEQLVASRMRDEPRAEREMIEFFMRMMEEGEISPPAVDEDAGKLFAEQMELAQQTEARLRDVLTEDERAEVMPRQRARIMRLRGG